MQKLEPGWSQGVAVLGTHVVEVEYESYYNSRLEMVHATLHLASAHTSVLAHSRLTVGFAIKHGFSRFSTTRSLLLKH